MAIGTLDELMAGMRQGVIYPLQKASLSGAVAASQMSLWRATGFPVQGSVPTTAAICNAALSGALPLKTKSAGQNRVLSGLSAQMAAIGHALLVEDRLAHMGGLVGNVTTAQTVNVDLHANLASSNIAERIGNADYSEVEWYLEWYTATGATVSTPTAQVTYNDGTTGSVNIWVNGATALPASVAASRRYKISPNNGKYIRSIQTVTLSASTATAGNFGVTAVRSLCQHECTVASALQVRDWSMLAAPEIFDNACVALSQMCITTTTGATTGAIKQAVN